MATLLVDLLTQGADIVQQARGFWHTQVLEQPLDYDARSCLARLESQQGNASAAWALLEESFPLMEVHPVMPLRSACVDLDECITALACLPQYTAFRARYSVSDYWQRDDPLYDLPFAPPVSDALPGALTTFLTIPFGLGWKHLAHTSGARASQETLLSFCEVIRPRIEHALIEAAPTLVSLLPPSALGAEAVAHKMTEILRFLGLIALREFGRQRGWIVSQCRIAPEVWEDALAGYDEERIEANVMRQAFCRLTAAGQDRARVDGAPDA